MFHCPERYRIQVPGKPTRGVHPHCLHLWRARDLVFPLPPDILI